MNSCFLMSFSYTPLWLYHNWQSCDLYFLFKFSPIRFCCFVSFSDAITEISFDRNFIIKISESTCHWINWLIESILISMVKCISIDSLIKLKLMDNILSFFFGRVPIILINYLKAAILFNNLTKVNNESIIGINLLTHKAIFSKVSINDFPSVSLSDCLPCLWHSI